jgi:hypothetical protein
MVVIQSDGMGGYFVLDASQEGPDGECPVVVRNPGESEAGDDLEVIAEDFGVFFLEYARTALA